MKKLGAILFLLVFKIHIASAQTTIVDYNFENSTTTPTLTATGVTCTASTFSSSTTFGGTNTGAGAFTANNSSTVTAIAMTNSSGTNTNYFQFQLGGSNLNTYCCYKIYFQAQRSSSGAQTITLQYSTDGSTYTTFGTTASVGTSFTEITFDLCSITALNNQANVYFRLYASGASGTGTLRIDNFEVQASNSCGASNTITTGAVSTSPFNVDCSTSASGTVDFTSTGTYNAGNIYTAQLSDASGSFSSPTNIGTLSSTGNSGTISITIPANTANGTNYQIQIVSSNPSTIGSTSSVITINNSCVPTYPVLTGVIVDGCNTYSSTPSCGTTLDNTNCSEGRTEVIFFRNGTTAISAATVQAMTRHVVDYYTTAWSTLTYYTGISMNNTATTTSLNSSGCNAGTCGSCFVDAWSNGIPAYATFIMISDYYCIGSTDYSNLCNNSSTSPIYVIYFGASSNNSNNCGGGTTGDWDLSGNFTNYSGTGSVKGIAVDMSSLVAGSPTQYYTYNISSLSNCSGSADGAGVAFNGVSTSTASPTTPNAFTSCACNIPIILPVQLTEFSANRTEKDIMIKWTTSTEINSDYFEIQYSFDGIEFSPYARIKGGGNTDQAKNYKCPFTLYLNKENLYFRIKQVDFNGGYKYSNIISVIEDGWHQIKSFYNSSSNTLESEVYSQSQQSLNISLYDVSGNKINEKEILLNKGSNKISADGPQTDGVYILVYTLADGIPYHKKIVISK
ncbi:MAG: hypothetical protein ACXVC6_13000 [Bacteroidia bacterium]